MLSSAAAVSTSCSARTNMMVNSVLYANHKISDKIKNIDELPLFPFVKYETSSFFNSSYEKQEHKEIYLERLKRFLSPGDTRRVINDSDVESTCDDSDKDKSYEPTSCTTSESEYDDTTRELKNKKRKLKKLQSGKQNSQILKKAKIININWKNEQINKNPNEKVQKKSHFNFMKETDIISEINQMEVPNEEYESDNTKSEKTNDEFMNDKYKKTNKSLDKTQEKRDNLSAVMKERNIISEANQMEVPNEESETENSKSENNDFKEEANVLETRYEKGNEENISSTATKLKMYKRLSSIEKIERDKIKHPMRAICEGKCKRKCKSLTEENRQNIWTRFWNLDYTSRRKWLSKHVTLVPVKFKSMSAERSRSESRQFTLPLPDFTEIAVCRLTFLNTLGYTNDSVITELVAAMKMAPCGDQVKERRGGNHKPKINKDLIRNHIESFKPCISHYRRRNAPNVRYLPRELTIKIMYDDFNLINPGICKIEVYRQVLRDMNISLRQPKSDICEDCTTLENILKTSTSSDDTHRHLLNAHKLKAKKAISQYKYDSEQAIAEGNDAKRIYSMDLQKVMLLPIMPQCKSSFFISRLVVFNQTFATLNKNATNKSYCVLWHEALGGRKAEALVDAMLKVIAKERDVTEFVFWADNCTSQNKNWVLFTSLIYEVNRTATSPSKIIIRYLTTGHTHMSADGIHGNIEKKVGRKRNIYDFQELIDVVSSSRKNLEVLQLDEFHAWINKKRNTKKPEDPLKCFLIHDLVEVCFTKGNHTMKYKNDFEDEYKELDFLQKKYLTTSFTPEVRPCRGITSSKKEKIIQDLVPIMPENRKIFWKALPESETAADLVTNEQIDYED